jgi:hypothetical protein
MKLGPAWTAPRAHKPSPADAASELRIRMQAAADCFARAKADPTSIEGLLNQQLGRAHTLAALKLMPAETLHRLFAEQDR